MTLFCKYLQQHQLVKHQEKTKYMKNKINLILVACLLTICFGCKTYKLDNKDMEWNPYKAGDILVFKDDFGVFDTVYITSINVFTNPSDPLSVHPEHIQSMVVEASYTDPYRSNIRIEGGYLKLTKRQDGLSVYFDLKMRNALLYDNMFLAKDLDRLKPMRIDDPRSNYLGVIEIRSSDTQYANRSNFIKSFYWKKGVGYVKIQLANNTWMLVNKSNATIRPK